MIDGIWMSFIDRVNIFNIFGYIVDSTSKEQYFNFESTFLIIFKVQEMLGDTFPINIVTSSFT
jgi:hypothetical protein